MHYGENIIRSVVSGALHSLFKILFFPRLDVVNVDRDEIVPVRPRVLVQKAKSVEQLVDRDCQARVETAAEKKISLFLCGDIILPA